jgi:peptidoglycan/LPS O-acetylase OafA/YrhL
MVPEIFMSLIYLPALLFVRRFGRTFRLLGLIAAFYCYQAAIHYGQTYPSTYFYVFYLGLLVGTEGKALIGTVGAAAPCLAAVALLALMSTQILATFHLIGWMGSVLIPAIGSFYLVAWVSFGTTRVRTLLSGKLARSLGRISFSLYLIHWPLVPLAAAFSYAITRNIYLREAIVLVTVLPTALLLASIVFRCVETPFQKIGRDFARWATSAHSVATAPDGSMRLSAPVAESAQT